jgi:hypothetical protein
MTIGATTSGNTVSEQRIDLVLKGTNNLGNVFDLTLRAARTAGRGPAGDGREPGDQGTAVSEIPLPFGAGTEVSHRQLSAR